MTTEFTWQCPVCESPLALDGKTWRCEQAHSFDCAKEGYVNLLLAQHKNSQSPGDSKEMIAARRAFLATDAYKPLAHKLSSLLLAHATDLNTDKPFRLFDAGCGEAYYTRTIDTLWHEVSQRIRISGIDISKPAIQKAAKANKHGYFAVASTFNIPLPSASQDAVIQVFSPSRLEEVARVLSENGVLITVNPAQDHLIELKQYVYDNPQPHAIAEDESSVFRMVDRHRLTFSVPLNSEQERAQLLEMTPFYWRISQHNKALLYRGLEVCTADFDIRVFRLSEVCLSK
ncbi:methyltransferase domain-containing protein [Glaciecola sp. XM2]|uniref:putative RNA methyltransferase n=1 Tax=Glaciecola sp. XM2 TaxID=1914931 RepID=UPI001BDF60A3|nr:methyltransferase domain-containing protein [Glaciecola sp. XM2]MBT1451618.1 methyltransferase domain-containing protein [Glaciecola sp. XM2]